MDNLSQDMIPIGRSPKREVQLQGPRPTPLRVNKDSHKIKKPPVGQPPPQPQAPPRQPVIIYTVSPKVIHTTPSDFMSLVQRLTGSSSSSSSSSNVTTKKGDDNNTTISGNSDNNHNITFPETRYTAIEITRTTQNISRNNNSSDDVVGGVDVIHEVLERPDIFHGILSPGPSSLTPIPSNFFSPPSSDPNMVSFFHDLSPVLHSSRNFMEGSFIMPSLSTFVSPRTPSIDLFNIFSDNYNG